MNAPTDWTSAIAILVAGLIVGAMVVFFFSKRKTKTIGDDRDLVRKDLEAKRDALIARLRDLDETSSPDERARLERETADVLRKLDAAPRGAAAKTATTAPAPAPTPSGMNPTIKGFLWGAGSFTALAGLFYLVMQMATPRQEGGQLTGNLPNEQQAPPLQAAQQQPNPQIMQLEAMVKNDPNNLELRNQLAQAYLETDNLMAVFEQTKFILEKKPGDSRAMTFQALVRMAMGESDLAEKMLQQAAKNDPKNLDSWVALAWVYAQQNKMKEAEAMIAEAAKQSPADRERLDQVFRQMQISATQQPQQPPQQAGGLPLDHPPIDGASPAGGTPPAPSGERSITVTLDLDPSARAKSGILFVIARNPAGGPPAAVKRVQVAQFPITVNLSQADSMMGQPLPDLFRLEARLDADGNAMTKTPNDPSAMQDSVTPGATVRLALK